MEVCFSSVGGVPYVIDNAALFVGHKSAFSPYLLSFPLADPLKVWRVSRRYLLPFE